MRLADHTTLRVGGPAGEFVTIDTDDELTEVVRDSDQDGVAVLLLGGGSNVVVGDAGFDGRVVQVNTQGLTVDALDDDHVTVTVAAGVEWDEVAAQCVADGLVGVESLSGIPGTVGATPIQNIGAYGQEIAGAIGDVRVFDRRSRTPGQLTAAECGFGYRTSRFKIEPDRFVILSVSLRLARSRVSEPIRYPELGTRLGVGTGGVASLSAVREAVLELRRGKGMVLDATDHDTWSAGSFFTNPVLDADLAAQLPGDAPRWPASDGRIKISAAWLIERAGYGKGFALTPDAGAAVSSKHSLALTNRGDASTADLLALARAIRDGVQAEFSVALVPEPTLVNCGLGGAVR